MNFKPFYIKYEGWMTDGQVQEVLNKAVSAGAKRMLGVKSLSDDKETTFVFTPCCWRYFGVDEYNITEASDASYCFGEDVVLLTLDQVDAHLGLDKPEPINNRVVNTPKSLANVKLDCRKPDGSVDEELSRAFQEACFEQVIQWKDNGSTIRKLQINYLYTNGSCITYGIVADNFNSDHRKEIKFTYERKLVWDYEVVAKEEPPERKVITIGGVEYYEDLIAPMLEAIESARVDAQKEK